jgi:sporulation protein YlmC with PRC-barrel domain
MKRIIAASICAAAVVVFANAALAQTAGSATLGVTVTEIKVIAKGWSVKQSLLDQPVYNEANKKIGEVEDMIIAPDSSVSYAILSVGGFLGMGTRDVAIPAGQFKMQEDGTIQLPGADKKSLKAMPVFHYEAKKK